MQLRGATAIVTGAGGGIGAALVRHLRARDAAVVALDRDPAVSSAWSGDGRVLPLVADVTEPTHAAAAVDAALDRFGRLDVVIANAGVGYAGEFATMPPERIDALLAINVRAPMLLARAALPAYGDGGGALVLVTSIAGLLLVPQEAVYSASKAALEAFAEPLREEVRDRGITVTTVAPAVVATGFFTARGAPYLRGRPRPITADRVASATLRAVERGHERVVVPGAFRLPVRVRGVAPATYRRLARRWG